MFVSKLDLDRYVSFSFIVVIKNIIEIRNLVAAHCKSKYVETREVF